MFFYLRCPHGLKRAQAHVQSEFGGFDSPLCDSCEDLGREVQPGSRCRYRSPFPRIDRLVSIAIDSAIFSRNVRWQRNMTEPLQAIKEIRHGFELNATPTKGARRGHFLDEALTFA